MLTLLFPLKVLVQLHQEQLVSIHDGIFGEFFAGHLEPFLCLIDVVLLL